MEKEKFKFTRHDIVSFVGVAFGTGIYCFGIVFILNMACFYGGGITGLAQLIMRVIEKFTGVDLSYILGVLIGLINIPLFILGWKKVSRKFAILTAFSVGLQSLYTLLFTYLYNKGFSPFSIFSESKITLAILAGLIMGSAQGIGLRVGGSTGGTDIISQAYSFKTRTSFISISFYINFVIIVLGGILNGLEAAAYTIIYLIISVTVLGKVFTTYKFMRVTIVTEEKGRLKEELLKHFNHGITIYQAVGAYSNTPKYVLETIVSSYEVREYRALARKIDPNCFIAIVEMKSIDGFFNQNAVA